MGYRGLALATSIASLVNASLCITLLRAHLDGIGGRSLIRACGKVVVAAVTMMAGVAVTRAALPVGAGHVSSLAQGVSLLAMMGVGITVLVITSHLLGIEELDVLASTVRRKFATLRNR